MNSQHLLIIYDNPMVLCLNPYFSISFQAQTNKNRVKSEEIPGCRKFAPTGEEEEVTGASQKG